MLVSRMDNGEPEVFGSIQGEGVSVGRPSVFVRLAECNLRCSYCDTKYTWDWEHHDRDREVMDVPIDELATRIRRTAGPNVRNAIITGGEPLLHQAEIAELGRGLRADGFALEVETNGTVAPTDELAAVIDQWNVSPKLESSGNRLRARLRTGPLTWFAANPRANFKFVVISEADVEEVRALAQTYAIPAARITLMPEGTDAETLRTRGVWVAQICQDAGYRFSTRLHVLLWGSQRGT